MKKIKQQVETSFVGIEIKDAIVIAPIMDELKSSLIYGHVFTMNGNEMSKEHVRKMFNTLAELGFVCTDGTNDIPELDQTSINRHQVQCVKWGEILTWVV